MIDGKYLMVWTGRVTGSLGGRDDGQPIERNMVIKSFESLALNYREDATFYKLNEIDVEAAVKTYRELQAET